MPARSPPRRQTRRRHPGPAARTDPALPQPMARRPWAPGRPGTALHGAPTRQPWSARCGPRKGATCRPDGTPRWRLSRDEARLGAASCPKGGLPGRTVRRRGRTSHARPEAYGALRERPPCPRPGVSARRLRHDQHRCLGLALRPGRVAGCTEDRVPDRTGDERRCQSRRVDGRRHPRTRPATAGIPRRSLRHRPGEGPQGFQAVAGGGGEGRGRGEDRHRLRHVRRRSQRSAPGHQHRPGIAVAGSSRLVEQCGLAGQAVPQASPAPQDAARRGLVQGPGEEGPRRHAARTGKSGARHPLRHRHRPGRPSPGLPGRRRQRLQRAGPPPHVPVPQRTRDFPLCGQGDQVEAREPGHQGVRRSP